MSATALLPDLTDILDRLQNILKKRRVVEVSGIVLPRHFVTRYLVPKIHLFVNMAGRNWCFTLNNPTFDSQGLLAILNADESVRYAVFQLEKGESETEHFQGYVEFSKVRKIGGLKKLLPRAHWETRKGTREQARDYCMKSDSRVQEPVEIGDFSKGGQGARADLVSAMSLVKQGKTDLEIAEAVPSVWLRYSRGLREYKRLCTPARTTKTLVRVFLGPTGTGKSRKAFEEYPGAYFKPRGEWWDGYEGQATVVLDDYTGWLPYSFLLNLFDRYPLLVPFKGGFSQMVATTIIVTTNFRPEDWYTDKVRHPNAPLLRRIEEIVLFETPQVHVDNLTIEQLIEYLVTPEQ